MKEFYNLLKEEDENEFDWYVCLWSCEEIVWIKLWRYYIWIMVNNRGYVIRWL